MTNGYSYEYAFGEHKISEMQGQPCPTVPTIKQLAKRRSVLSRTQSLLTDSDTIC